MPIVTMDPMKLFTAIGSAICTLLLFAFICVVIWSTQSRIGACRPSIDFGLQLQVW
jgi:hypothetical protein